MRTTTRAADPFVMLTDPQAFLNAIEASPRLKAMSGRICRPLDRPVLRKGAADAAAAFDAEVDGTSEADDDEAPGTLSS